MPKRINLAMWSGPRNLSTALMRSFGNREDVIDVMDEPFYASYLKETDKKHPMFNEIISSQESNWKKVIGNCSQQEGKGICYQKHMVHHLLPSFDKDWLLQCLNCFLIREPKEVISSFLYKWPNATFEDLPKDIEESSYIDGASYLSTFYKISLPISRNGIVAVGILCFLFSWILLCFLGLLPGEDAPSAAP